jgi:2-methylaconitate cis-trans-isomerase PrpF
MESIAKLNGNIDLIDQVARIRQSGRAMMGISSQIDNRLPIVILVAEPNVDANINVTTFLGTSFGNTLGILAAIGVASVFAKQGSVLDDRVRQCGRKSGIIGICDHFGTIFVEIELDPIDGQRVTHASVLRSIKLNRAILAMPSSSASELHSTSPRNLL